MTTDEWMHCGTKPALMFRRVAASLSTRKLQLLACALSRLLPPAALEEWARTALDHAEQFAEGDLPAAEFRLSAERVRAACDDLEMRQAVHGDVPEEALSAATTIQCATGTANLAKSIPALMEHVQRHDQLTTPRGQKTKSRTAMLSRQCEVVREVATSSVLNYKRTSVATDPAIQLENETLFKIDSVSRGIAEGVLQDQAYDRLPVLADALEEHGLTDAAILAHLRGDGPHTRGCWALDLILGRG
jgi:hypothetical protein